MPVIIHQQLKGFDIINLVQRRFRRQSVELFKCLNKFTTAIARRIFDYDLNDRTIKIKQNLL